MSKDYSARRAKEKKVQEAIEARHEAQRKRNAEQRDKLIQVS